MSVESDLEQSMAEELAASEAYGIRADHADYVGDNISAGLWRHIAEEERGHYNEFKDRLAVLRQEEPGITYETARATEVLERISEPLIIEERGVYRERMRRKHRMFPITYGDWVNLAEDIKTADPTSASDVNSRLNLIAHHPEYDAKDVYDAKRWLVRKAGELEIG